MVKKVFSWICLVLIVAVLLPGCSPIANPSSDHLPFRVEYTLWEGDYTLLIAQEKGFFKEHGIQVEPVFYDTFSRALPDIAAKRIDIGLFSIGDLLMTSRVADIRGIAVYDSGGESVVIARPDIASIADLRGRKIGVNIGASGELFVREMLKSAKLTINDVTLVEMDPEVITDKLSSKEVAAGYTWAPYDKKAQDSGNKLLYTNQEVGSLFPDVITIRGELADNRPQDVKAFLAAWFEAVDYRLNHPDDCSEIIARLTKQTVSEVAPSGSVKLYTKEENTVMFDQLGTITKDSTFAYAAQANADFQIATGSLTSKPNLTMLLDRKFLP
jgi:NitT/TauT family transport system substrate-binding protein